jgi:hypothetical protein
MRNFSWEVMLQPGDCSPSRKVVSKIWTRSRSNTFPPIPRPLMKFPDAEKQKGHHPLRIMALGNIEIVMATSSAES